MNPFPKKDQAIILSVDDNLKLGDYVTSISEIVQPKNITFASRISNNRVCIYLNSSQLAESLARQHKSIVIKGIDISIRRLITPSKRIILSNVCPSIPHNMLEQLIRQIGLQPLSTVSFLRAGIPGEQFAHILSFRRQIYVEDNKDIELPSSMVITFEDTSYRIFLNHDDMCCFICKKPGHIASQCTQHAEPSMETVAQNRSTTDAPIITSNSIEQTVSDSETSAESPPVVEFNKISTKRLGDTLTPSTTETSPPSPSSGDEPFAKPTKPPTQNPRKRPKIDPAIVKDDIKEQLEPLRTFFGNLTPTPTFALEKLIYLFENISGCPSPLTLARELTDDIPALIKILADIHPQIMALNLQLLNPTPTALKLATNNLVPTYYILLQNGFDCAKEHKRVLHTSSLARYSGRSWKKYRLASTMKNKCSVIQANLHKSRCATLETLAYIRQENIDIALCQEPYNYKTSRGTYTIPGLMNQRLIANNDNRFFSCLLVNNPTLNVLHLRHLSSKYVTVVSIDGISTESVFVISIYAPPNNDSIRNMVTKLQQILTNLQDKTILLGGDFNCRSTIWFDTLCDRNSPVLEDFILANDLVIFNEDNLPSTFSSANGSSNIDLTLGTTDTINWVRDWTVLQDVNTSDHRVIRFTCALPLQSAASIEEYVMDCSNLKLEDIEQDLSDLCRGLLRDFPVLVSPRTIDASVDRFYEGINRIVRAKVKKRRTYPERPEWWTSKIERLRKVYLAKKKILYTNRYPDQANLLATEIPESMGCGV
ncbi:hypothetical protein GEV33_005513 [Tenebrio molitor]|uniref:CCHC-type domain-containing protein n=1 Tax=Tenebrio molitor TaxID=7067 RepID=A0A8J6HPH0_TENMO|nr:hypothetical protein GEV33_005513 [Tenebrio molitor]